MTAVLAVTAATVEEPVHTAPRHRRPVRARVTDLLARWALLAVLTGVGFLETWVRIGREEAAGAGNSVMLAPVVGAVLTAVVLWGRRRPHLPIHDRQTDKIVGTVVLVIALMVQWLVLPRYAGSYVLLHLDVLASWVFVLGACIFLFGLRSTGSFWPAWLVLVAAPPGLVRLLAFALGGDTADEVTAGVIVMLAGPVSVIVPGLIRRLQGRTADGAARRGGLRRPVAPMVSGTQAWRSAPLLLTVALALALAPLPHAVSERLSAGPPAATDPGQTLPAGWLQVGSVDYPWAERMFGPSATLHRQTIRATGVRADWDPLLRPRMAAVQSLTVGDTGVLEVFPLEMTLDLSDARVSPPREVDLGRSVTALYRTVIDERELLTWSLMTFQWNREPERVQRVTILTVDNHEYDAQFPDAVPGTRSNFQRLTSLLLRGSAAVTDTDPQDKDLDMLTELGTALVEAQWTGG